MKANLKWLVPVLMVWITATVVNEGDAGASNGGQAITFVVSNSILQTVSGADGNASFSSAMHPALCAPRFEPNAKRFKNVKGGVQFRVVLTAAQVTSIRKALRRNGCSGNIASDYKDAVKVTNRAAIQVDSTTTTTIDPTTAYVNAFNALGTALNADLTQQNSSTPSVSAAGINAEIAAYKTFDSVLMSIDLPSDAKADARKLLEADAALEGDLGTLAANTGSVINYNQIFDAMTPDQSAVTATQSALNDDLGVTTSG